MAAAEELGQLIADLQRKVEILERASQAQHSTVETAAGTLGLGDAAATAVDTAAALPVIEESADTAQATADSLAVMADGWDDDLNAYLEDMAADLDDATSQLEDAQQEITDAFGQQLSDISDKVDQIVVGAGGTLLLFSDEAPTSDDKAPTGSTWWMVNEDENLVGQWQQTGTDDAPVWTPRAIESDIIANLDVGKLSAGQAAIAQVVAMKIAASTASIQTVNVENLFVTSGATMKQAVIDYLFANVVAAKKITADMIDVNSLSGITLTGTTLQTALSGERVVITAPGGAQGYTNAVNWFTSAETAGSVRGFGSLSDGSRYPGLSIVSGQDKSGRLGDLAVAMQPLYDANYADGNAVNAPKVGVVTSRSLHAQGHLQARGYLASASGLMLRYATDNDWTKNWFPVIKPGVGGAFTFDTNGGLISAATVTASATVVAGDFRLPDGSSVSADTGWVNLMLRSGYSAHSGRTPQVRRKGGVTYMRGGIAPTAGGNFASTTYQVAADLPPGFIAPGQNSYFLAFVGTNGASGLISIEGTTVRLTPGGSAVSYMYLNNVIYFEG